MMFTILSVDKRIQRAKPDLSSINRHNLSNCTTYRGSRRFEPQHISGNGPISTQNHYIIEEKNTLADFRTCNKL